MVSSGLFHSSTLASGLPAMRNLGIAQVIVPLTRSAGSSGETVETEEEEEVVARMAIAGETRDENTGPMPNGQRRRISGVLNQSVIG